MRSQEITKQENELLIQISNVSGSMNEKAQQLMDKGIFEAYKNIHYKYANLAAFGNIEALKHATFIQWYSASEPSCFTGIPGTNPWSMDLRLDKETEKMVLKLVRQSILSGNIDAEFKAMLAWYIQISEYYFKSFWKNYNLLRKLFLNPKKLSYQNILNQLSKENFSNRGQMGKYWLSILARNDPG